MLKKFNISTKKDDVYEITADVKQAVEESGVKEGICVVFTPHTTAAIVVTSRMDPDGFEDLRDEVNRLIGLHLSERDRMILIMRDRDEFEIDAIAARTGLSEGNIRLILSRARRTVREAYRNNISHGK